VQASPALRPSSPSSLWCRLPQAAANRPRSRTGVLYCSGRS
jgi:hypothetical protein